MPSTDLIKQLQTLEMVINVHLKTIHILFYILFKII